VGAAGVPQGEHGDHRRSPVPTVGAVSTPAAAPSTPVQLVASLRLVALVVTAVIVALAAVLLVVVLPESGTGLVGLGVGLVLGVAALVASRVVPPRRAAPMVVDQSQQEVLAQVRGSAFVALVVVEVVAVLAFAVSVVVDDRGPYLVAAPLAVVALLLNATSAPALRRHLTHLESAGVTSGVRL
jgi:hypothetical protein